MGRKEPILLSTLMLLVGSLTLSSVAWAEGGPYWHYDELQALSMELEPEIIANCGGDPMCREMYIPMNKSGDKYSALNRYRDRGLTITSADFNRKTIKIAYDPGVLSEGRSTPLSIKDIYVVQFDEGYTDGGFADKIEAGVEVPHMRTLVMEQDANLAPYTEIEFSTPELSAEAQADKWIYVFFRTSGPGIRWVEAFGFSNCLGSENYQEDTECRVRYDIQDISYEPVAVVNELRDLTSHPDTLMDSATVPGSQESQLDTTENNLDNETGNRDNASADSANEANSSDAASTNNSSDDPIAAATQSASSPSTPETGIAGGYDASAIEFPWWLGAIFGLGSTTLAWLFWPTRKKSAKKS